MHFLVKSFKRKITSVIYQIELHKRIKFFITIEA